MTDEIKTKQKNRFEANLAVTANRKMVIASHHIANKSIFKI